MPALIEGMTVEREAKKRPAQAAGRFRSSLRLSGGLATHCAHSIFRICVHRLFFYEVAMSLNYVMIGSNDVVRARSYFDAVMPLIGGRVVADFMPHGFCYELRGGGRLWVAPPFDKQAATPGNGNMVGVLCLSADEVRAAHAAALANGGTNEGDPGPRPQYGPNFFGSYVRDPDGNKMSFVHFPTEA